MNAREWALRIADLARRESCSLVDLLVALVEFDRLGASRQLGHASLFDFLHREVGLSRGSAYHRQVASRLLGRFPEIAGPPRDGRLCMSNFPQPAEVMTEENRSTLPAKFFHCSKQEARRVVAEILPAEVVPTRTVVSSVAPTSVQPVERDRTHPGRARPAPEVQRTVVEPLTRTETRMHVTVSTDFVALLKKPKGGESHRNPGATDEQVLKAALDLLIAQQGKRRASVPPKVRRAVIKRDGSKCTWPLADHVVPRGRGGPSTVENCRVLRDVHDREAARQVYGDAHMDLFTRNPVAHERSAACGHPGTSRLVRRGSCPKDRAARMFFANLGICSATPLLHEHLDGGDTPR